MQVLVKLLQNNENWLIDRVIQHATEHDYTRYTSTLREAWRVSIAGLSGTIIKVLKQPESNLELGPDEDYQNDSVVQFGILQAQRHRARGVSLSMFLGLMKYYRQSYQELVEGFSHQLDIPKFRRVIERCFDRIEIGFCAEWSKLSESEVLEELRKANRNIINEKNKYLTIFESIHLPVFLLDDENKLDNANQIGLQLMMGAQAPGAKYYSPRPGNRTLPWLQEEVETFKQSEQSSLEFEKRLPTIQGERFFLIRMRRMLDVSDKFRGTVIVLYDITEKKRIQDELHQASIHDELTGLFNRRGFFQMVPDRLRLAQRVGLQTALLFGDLNQMKWINDKLGHQTGDLALTDVASVLKNTFRESDILARFGGDEFVVFATDVGEEALTHLVDRLHENLQAFSSAQKRPYMLSLSIGFAVARPDSKTKIDHLLRQADHHMYERKRNFRSNRQNVH